MGKAAKIAKAKRRKHLKHLSKTNPKQFDCEWRKKRIPSWERELMRSPNKYKTSRNNSLLDEALCILKQCGEGFFKKYSPMTIAILDANRFNPSFFQTDPRSLSNYARLEEMGRQHGILKGGRKPLYYERPLIG